jgi:hypothetical protein
MEIRGFPFLPRDPDASFFLESEALHICDSSGQVF